MAFSWSTEPEEASGGCLLSSIEAPGKLLERGTLPESGLSGLLLSGSIHSVHPIAQANIINQYIQIN
jgi:hypothetical protein